MKKTLFYLLIACALVSCNYTKASYLNNFREFIRNVEEQCEEYSDMDWDMVNDKFGLLAGKYYNRHKKRLTYEERQEISQMKVIFIRLRFKKPIYLLDNELTDFLRQYNIALD